MNNEGHGVSRVARVIDGTGTGGIILAPTVADEVPVPYPPEPRAICG